MNVLRRSHGDGSRQSFELEVRTAGAKLEFPFISTAPEVTSDSPAMSLSPLFEHACSATGSERVKNIDHSPRKFRD
jgi:hypothetical protein